MAAHLEAALADGDPALVSAALGDIARETSPGRASLYEALSLDGNPEFSTVLKVVKALGFTASCNRGESPRDSRRLHFLRGWSL
jgi:probable addiction module antidote protein